MSLATKGFKAFRLSPTFRHEIRTNLAIICFDLLFVAPVLLILWRAQASLDFSTLAGEMIKTLPIWCSVLMAVLLGDLVGYWRHRLQHIPQFWPAHAFHHSDEAFSWLTSLRMHPFDRVSNTAIDVGALLFVGFPAEVVIANGLIRHYWGYFIHADAPITLGKLDWILISPAAHRLHHIREEDRSGRNFATVFTFWDRIFRTWADPRGWEHCNTGIESGSKGFIGEMMRPVTYCVRQILRKFQ